MYKQQRRTASTPSRRRRFTPKSGLFLSIYLNAIYICKHERIRVGQRLYSPASNANACVRGYLLEQKSVTHQRACSYICPSSLALSLARCLPLSRCAWSPGACMHSHRPHKYAEIVFAFARIRASCACPRVYITQRAYRTHRTHTRVCIIWPNNHLRINYFINNNTRRHWPASNSHTGLMYCVLRVENPRARSARVCVCAHGI